MKKRVAGLAPLETPGARALVLGSMPGERSLEEKAYYAHPMNQFWKILGSVLGGEPFRDYAAKKAFLKRHRLAVWDVVKSCQRHRSADLSICRAEVNDIPAFLARHPGVRHILLNGRAAEKYFLKAFGRKVPLPRTYVPSSSPAHAGRSFAAKALAWKKAFIKAGILKGA